MPRDDKQPIRVVIAEDHSITRAGLRGVLEASSDIILVGEAKDGEEALHLALKLEPEVLLLDVEMPKLNGVEIAERLREVGSPVRLLALSAYDDEQYVYGLLDFGAHGYLLKEEAEPNLIVSAICGVAGEDSELWLSESLANRLIRRRVMRKLGTRSDLSEREVEVLKLVALGFDNERIAKELHLAKSTIKNHIERIKNTKIDVRTRSEMIAWAWQHGYAKRSDNVQRTLINPLSKLRKS